MTRAASIVLCLALALVSLAHLPVVVAAQDEPVMPEALTGTWEGTARWEGDDVKISIDLYTEKDKSARFGSDRNPDDLPDGEIEYDFGRGYDVCVRPLRLRDILADGSWGEFVDDYPSPPYDEGGMQRCHGSAIVSLSLRPDGTLAFESSEEKVPVGRPGAPPVEESGPKTLIGTLKHSSCTWSGYWSTNWDPMSLTQLGDEVTGTYVYDQGTISGIVFGNQLIGTWTEAPTHNGPKDAGAFKFTMAADCKSFTGTWNYADESELGGDWHGTRAG